MNNSQNRAYTTNMTVGKPWKVIVAFAFPIFLSQLFQQLYNSADAFIVGHFIDTNALAAVTSSGSLIFLFVSFFVGTSMGAGVVISRYFGAGDDESVSRAIHTNVALGLISGVLLTIVGVLLTPYILRWMGTPEEVLPLSTVYFRNYFYGAIAVVMYNTFTGIMNAVGDSRRPLIYLIISSLLNVALDYIFVGVMGFGVGSAAIATTISQAFSCILCIVHLMKKGNVFSIELKKIHIYKDMLIETVRFGLPTGVQNSVIGFANVIVQTNINSFDKIAMAGCGAYYKVEGFAFLPITCFAMALSTFVSQNLGAKQYDRVKKAARFGITTSVILAELTGIIIYVFAPVFVAIFDDDPQVIAVGVEQCRVESLAYCLLAISHTIAGILRGAGKATVPMIIMLSVWCVYRIAYITFAMSVCHDIFLVFMCYPITWTISTMLFFVYYFKVDWIHGFDKLRDPHRHPHFHFAHKA